MWRIWRPKQPRKMAQPLDERMRKHANAMMPQLHIVSDSEQWHYTAPGTDTNQPFHMASIGKMFTALLIMRLVERGRLRLDQLVCDILDATVLQRLFVYRGVNDALQVTVAQLLGHTAGLADYFEGRTRGARPCCTRSSAIWSIFGDQRSCLISHVPINRRNQPLASLFNIAILATYSLV